MSLSLQSVVPGKPKLYLRVFLCLKLLARQLPEKETVFHLRKTLKELPGFKNSCMGMAYRLNSINKFPDGTTVKEYLDSFSEDSFHSDDNEKDKNRIIFE